MIWRSPGVSVFSRGRLYSTVFSTNSLNTQRSVPREVFLQNSFKFYVPNSCTMCIHTTNLRLRVPLPSILRRHFPNSIIRFQRVLLHGSSIVRGTRCHRDVTKTIRAIVLAACVFIRYLCTLVCFRVFLVTKLHFFVLRRSFRFHRGNATFALRNPTCRYSNGFLLTFVRFCRATCKSCIFRSSGVVVFNLLGWAFDKLTK